jgi:hypothetical protein
LFLRVIFFLILRPDASGIVSHCWRSETCQSTAERDRSRYHGFSLFFFFFTFFCFLFLFSIVLSFFSILFLSLFCHSCYFISIQGRLEGIKIVKTDQNNVKEHILCNILKNYLRAMPDPLCTDEKFIDFVEAVVRSLRNICLLFIFFFLFYSILILIFYFF